MIDRLLQRIDPVEALTEPIVSLMPAQVTIIDVLIMLIAAIVYFWNNLSDTHFICSFKIIHTFSIGKIADEVGTVGRKGSASTFPTADCVSLSDNWK